MICWFMSFYLKCLDTENNMDKLNRLIDERLEFNDLDSAMLAKWVKLAYEQGLSKLDAIGIALEIQCGDSKFVKISLDKTKKIW